MRIFTTRRRIVHFAMELASSPLRRGSAHGLTLVEVLVSLSIIATLVGFFLPAIQRARSAAAKTLCQSRLKQIGMALHGHHNTESHFPAGVSIGQDGGRFRYMSWQTRLLPYLELDPLWSQVQVAYRQNPNFLSDPHRSILGSWVPAFTCPSDPRSSTVRELPVSGRWVGLTDFLGVAGLNQFSADGVLYRDSATRITDIADGTSNTLIVGERPPSQSYAYGWWYAGWGQNQNGSADMILGVREIPEGPQSCLKPVGGLVESSTAERNHCEYLRFWSFHTGVANFAFADGSVRFLRYEADSIMPALASRAGGEAVTIPD